MNRFTKARIGKHGLTFDQTRSLANLQKQQKTSELIALSEIVTVTEIEEPITVTEPIIVSEPTDELVDVLITEPVIVLPEIVTESVTTNTDVMQSLFLSNKWV